MSGLARLIILAFLAAASLPGAALSNEVTLRLHQFLPAQSIIPLNGLKPWADKVMQESGGRIRIELYPSMQLGGRPPELYDQVKDGVVDLAWTVLGYTPGRFPKTEAFELPFMVTTGAATSKAFHQFVEKHAMDEFAEVKPILFHTHGPGLIHSKRPVHALGDMAGLKVRGASRMVNRLLETLKATPVGMPVPSVPEALSRGVLDATTIPWEVSATLKVPELVRHHTVFPGREGLYTITFIFAMNRGAYERLPADLKAVIDANSGSELAGRFGAAMDEGDKLGIAMATGRGNDITTLSEAEAERWKAAAAPVTAEWVAEMRGRGIDGAALIEDARALIGAHSQ